MTFLSRWWKWKWWTLLFSFNPNFIFGIFVATIWTGFLSIEDKFLAKIFCPLLFDPRERESERDKLLLIEKFQKTKNDISFSLIFLLKTWSFDAATAAKIEIIFFQSNLWLEHKRFWRDNGFNEKDWGTKSDENLTAATSSRLGFSMCNRVIWKLRFRGKWLKNLEQIYLKYGFIFKYKAYFRLGFNYKYKTYFHINMLFGQSGSCVIMCRPNGIVVLQNVPKL